MLAPFTRGGERGPIKLLDVDVSSGLPELTGLHDYVAAIVLVWLHSAPVGYVRVPIRRGTCSVGDLQAAIIHGLGPRLAQRSLEEGDGLPAAEWGAHPMPSLTVAVCTHARVTHLKRCLEALQSLDYPELDILVVDNAPEDHATRRLVGDSFPAVRYVVEPCPGLARARNTALRQGGGDVVAFTDDDCIPDAGWAAAIGRSFAEDEEVMAVTGLVVPAEMETLAQVYFERSGGFGKGFDKRRYQRRSVDRTRDGFHLGAGRFGTGANMAFRRSVFMSVGLFDIALGAGTPARGGEDLDMFFRVLEEGYVLTYEPRSLVRHVHRRDVGALLDQLESNGTALYAYFAREIHAYPRRWAGFTRLALRWLWRRNLRRLLSSMLHPGFFPPRLVMAELHGSLRGAAAYGKGRRPVATDGVRHPSVVDSFVP